MVGVFSIHGITLLAQSGLSTRQRRGANFIENMCGGAAEASEWCQWQVYGLGALSIGGLWLLYQLAKWGLAPRDERETPQPLALGLALVITISGLMILVSNDKPAASEEASEQDAPVADPLPLIDPNA